MVHKGGAWRSRTDKPRFRVPLSELDLANGGWVPIPRLLLDPYMITVPSSLLLIVVIYFQHLSWRNDCWVGMKGLRKMLRWKRRTIYHALNLMGHRHRWEKLKTGLPWPLEISFSNTGARHFSVRGVRYYLPKGRQKRVVGLSQEFAVHFEYSASAAKNDEEVED